MNGTEAIVVVMPAVVAAATGGWYPATGLLVGANLLVCALFVVACTLLELARIHHLWQSIYTNHRMTLTGGRDGHDHWCRRRSRTMPHAPRRTCIRALIVSLSSITSIVWLVGLTLTLRSLTAHDVNRDSRIVMLSIGSWLQNAVGGWAWMACLLVLVDDELNALSRHATDTRTARGLSCLPRAFGFITMTLGMGGAIALTVEQLDTSGSLIPGQARTVFGGLILFNYACNLILALMFSHRMLTIDRRRSAMQWTSALVLTAIATASGAALALLSGRSTGSDNVYDTPSELGLMTGLAVVAAWLTVLVHTFLRHGVEPSLRTLELDVIKTRSIIQQWSAVNTANGTVPFDLAAAAHVPLLDMDSSGSGQTH